MRIHWVGWAVVLPMLLATGAQADEASAVAALEKLGAKIFRDEKQAGKPVMQVRLNGPKVTDVGLKELKDLKSLKELYLDYTKVTDAGLKELKDLKRLEYLNLRGTKVTDAGVKELQEALPECKIIR